MRIKDRIFKTLNEDYRDKVVERMRVKYGIEVENSTGLLTLRLVTRRVDGADFTPEQHADLAAFSDGFGEAMGIVLDQ